jgi:hypothetical protein
MFRTMKVQLFVAGASLLLLGGAIGGAAITSAVTTGAQTPPTTQQAAPATTAEQQSGTADSPEPADNDTTDPAEANEPQLPNGGHADPSMNTDHEFDGVE